MGGVTILCTFLEILCTFLNILCTFLNILCTFLNILCTFEDILCIISCTILDTKGHFNISFHIIHTGSRILFNYLLARPLRPYPLPLDLNGRLDFFFKFFCLKITENEFWQFYASPSFWTKLYVYICKYFNKSVKRQRHCWPTKRI